MTKKKTTTKKKSPAKKQSSKKTVKEHSAHAKKYVKHVGHTENHPIRRFLRKLGKILFIILVTFAVFMFLVWLFFGRSRLTDPEDIVWGTTYSALAAEELGLDPIKTYDAIIDDLKPDKLRLVAYWSRIEQEPGVYDFSELDYQVNRAEVAGIPYIIAVGNRVPRYPECHTPQWADQAGEREREKGVIRMIEKTIKRYDQNELLEMWQIENEAFVGSFGICPPINEDQLDKEVSLARSLTDKPIMLTESGELSLWFKASKYPDYLGTTLYRTVIVGKTDIVVNHIYPPWYYRARSNIVKLLHRNLDQVVVAELQGEPWASAPIPVAEESQLQATMNPIQFEENIDFTESVGFPEVYWWGVEWWYYELEDGNNYYWDRAKDYLGN